MHRSKTGFFPGRTSTFWPIPTYHTIFDAASRRKDKQTHPTNPPTNQPTNQQTNQVDPPKDCNSSSVSCSSVMPLTQYPAAMFHADLPGSHSLCRPKSLETTWLQWIDNVACCISIYKFKEKNVSDSLMTIALWEWFQGLCKPKLLAVCRLIYASHSQLLEPPKGVVKTTFLIWIKRGFWGVAYFEIIPVFPQIPCRTWWFMIQNPFQPAVEYATKM